VRRGWFGLKAKKNRLGSPCAVLVMFERWVLPFGSDLLFDYRESEADIKANDLESHSKDGLLRDTSQY
jgi:hypothetical protein